MNITSAKGNKRSIVLITIVAAIILLDQITKFVVKKFMFLYESIEVMGDFFKLTYIENPGMAFGIQMESKIWFTILSIFAALVVAVYLFRLKNESFPLRIALSMILGGAIGNLIDRLAYGKVVDFLDFEFFDISIPAFNFLFFNFPGYDLHRWPVFNVADMAVSCGMILITFLVFFPKYSEEKQIITES